MWSRGTPASGAHDEQLSFGELVTRRRLDLGLSQSELADRICAEAGRPTLTRHEVSRYEREVRLPTQTSLVAYAAALNLPPVVLARATQNTRARRHPRAPGSTVTHQRTAPVLPSAESHPGGIERPAHRDEYRSPGPVEKLAVARVVPSDGWRVDLTLRIGEYTGTTDEQVFVVVVRQGAISSDGTPAPWGCIAGPDGAPTLSVIMELGSSSRQP
ncbi:helix-turn-helix domain-containing protein [Planosporangium mesophilum]|uniref:HTH cro/C1-type domain-containing protein n=1 Tax=Planosporangium mesophilum TaxID=689768 RepID=A0A8J3X283_9ACTN|nr:helix-turn-helix transcriptional regulator [Planosporangium mesophilum]NJC85499.1 helix-turn-helix transcriptional regulator [Planosporangium mesophilum]GII24636.1 hypothetical protein Pme01_42330 [Planosporangium mesophilum]